MAEIKTKEEVIRRLCALASEVGTRRFNQSVYSNCFCDKSKKSDNFRMDESVIEFIETAVRDEISLDIVKGKGFIYMFHLKGYFE